MSIPKTVEISASTDRPITTSASLSFFSLGLGGLRVGGGAPLPPERTKRGPGVGEGWVMDVEGSCMLIGRPVEGFPLAYG